MGLLEELGMMGSDSLCGALLSTGESGLKDKIQL